MLTALAHSALGERLIFRHLREGGIVPTRAAGPLRERHIRILWATWHLASLFGLAFGTILLRAGAAGVAASEVLAAVATPTSPARRSWGRRRGAAIRAGRRCC